MISAHVAGEGACTVGVKGNAVSCELRPAKEAYRHIQAEEFIDGGRDTVALFPEDAGAESVSGMMPNRQCSH